MTATITAPAQPTADAPARPTASTTTGQIAKGTDAATAYKPETDSSPQHKKAAAADRRLHLDITDGACLCGCNQKAAGRFRPGHDAKLKGMLTRAALHEVTIVLHAGDKTAHTNPVAFATKLSTGKHDWAAALATSVERAKKAAADRAVKQAEAAKKREEAKKEQGSSKLSLDDFS